MTTASSVRSVKRVRFAGSTVSEPAIHRPGSAATLRRLREMIMSGELPPGSVVSQLDLARSLGISTTPLREVIRELQAEGLLEVELNRRPRVAPLNVDDLYGVYAGRILYESLAISLTVPMMTDKDLASLRALLTRMRSLAAAGDHARWTDVHLSFHRKLVVDVPTPIAVSIQNLCNRSERYRRLICTPGVPRSLGNADQEHQRIVEACVARDSSAAVTELANHLALTALSVSALFAPDADPLPVRQAVGMVTSRSQLLRQPQRDGSRTQRGRRNGVAARVG